MDEKCHEDAGYRSAKVIEHIAGAMGQGRFGYRISNSSRILTSRIPPANENE